MSDNGPEFSGKAYQQFCIEWDIRLYTNSPEYPQINGLTERTIQTIKQTLKKARKAGDDTHLTLLALRTEPRGSFNQEAISITFMGRKYLVRIAKISSLKTKSEEKTWL